MLVFLILAVVSSFKLQEPNTRWPKYETVYPARSRTFLELLKTDERKIPYLICDKFTFNMSDSDFPYYQKIRMSNYVELLNSYVRDCDSINPSDRAFTRTLNTEIKVTVSNSEEDDWTASTMNLWGYFDMKMVVDDDGNDSVTIRVKTKSGIAYAILTLINLLESFNMSYIRLLNTVKENVKPDLKLHTSFDSSVVYYGIWMRNMNIIDQPEYELRAWELDTSHDYLSLDLIKLNIDIAAYARFNSIVWRFYSSSVFSFVIDELLYAHGPDCDVKTKVNCQGLPCNGCGYDKAQIMEIIDYAYDHGMNIHFHIPIPHMTGSLDPTYVYANETCESNPVMDPHGVTCNGPLSTNLMTCSSLDYANPLHCRSPPCNQINIGNDRYRYSKDVFLSIDEQVVNADAIRRYTNVLTAISDFVTTIDANGVRHSRAVGDHLLFFIGLHQSTCLSHSNSWQLVILNHIADLAVQLHARLVVNYETLALIEQDQTNVNSHFQFSFFGSDAFVIPWVDTVSPKEFAFLNEHRGVYIPSIPSLTDLSCGPRGHPIGVGIPDSKCNTKITAESLYLRNNPGINTLVDTKSYITRRSKLNEQELGQVQKQTGIRALGSIARLDTEQSPSFMLTSQMWPRAAAVGAILWDGEGQSPYNADGKVADGLVFWQYWNQVIHYDRWSLSLLHAGYAVSPPAPPLCLKDEYDCISFRNAASYLNS